MNYIINFELNYRIGGSNFEYSYLCTSLSISLGFLLAYGLPRIPQITDKGIQIISNIIYLLEITILAGLNIFGKPFPLDASFLQTAIGSIILIFISLLSLLALYEIIRFAVLEKWISIQFLPIILSLYFLGVLTQNLISHYDLSFSSILISIFYVITSLVCIILGFKQKYPQLRRFGLGLSVLAVCKLFLIDLKGLTMGYQIISYFALGTTLVLISLVYQSFSKKLDIEVEASENV